MICIYFYSVLKKINFINNSQSIIVTTNDPITNPKNHVTELSGN